MAAAHAIWRRIHAWETHRGGVHRRCESGQVATADMFNTFNMGIGYVVIVPATAVSDAIAFFKSQQIAAYGIGTVVAGDRSLIGMPG